MILNNKPNNLSTNHFENNQFKNKNLEFQERLNQSQEKNIFTEDFTTQKHTNPIDKNDMSDKSLAMLHERLKQGTITLDEFNKKCEQLGKRRQQ